MAAREKKLLARMNTMPAIKLDLVKLAEKDTSFSSNSTAKLKRKAETNVDRNSSKRTPPAKDTSSLTFKPGAPVTLAFNDKDDIDIAQREPLMSVEEEQEDIFKSIGIAGDLTEAIEV
jgi:hypothetical protein